MSDLEQFSVNADWTGQVFVSCNVQEPEWCRWESDVPNGATLAEVLKIGLMHRDEVHPQ